MLMSNRKIVISICVLVIAMMLLLSFTLIACDKKEEAPKSLEDAIHNPFEGTDGVYTVAYDKGPMKMGGKFFSENAELEKKGDDYYLVLFQNAKKNMGKEIITDMHIKLDGDNKIDAIRVEYGDGYKQFFKVTKEMLTGTIHIGAIIPAKPMKDKSTKFDLVFNFAEGKKISNTNSAELLSIIK